MSAARARSPRFLVSVLSLLALGLVLLGLRPWRPASPPRLVVFLVVDQGRGDGAERLGEARTRDGFSRLMAHGAWFRDAHLRHLATWTASGHATLATGAYPDRHGVMANAWYEDGRLVKVAEDAAGDSDAARLRVPTLADALRMSHADARVVSVSLKGRAALVLGGEHATGRYFLDAATGDFVGDGPGGGPVAPWVSAFNARRVIDAPFGATWARTLPDAVLARSAGPDDCDRETDGLGLGRTFPHTVTGDLSAPGPAYYKALARTPLATGVLLDLALAAIDGEGLGADDTPDLLYVSISPTDYAGHWFGLQSWEYLEHLADLDRRLGPFLAEVERRVGRGRVGVVLTADHGGPPIAACIPDRVSGGIIGYGEVARAVEDALTARFGARSSLGPGVPSAQGTDGPGVNPAGPGAPAPAGEGTVTSPDPWLVGFEPPGLTLDVPPGVDAAAVRAEATRALLKLPGMLDVCDAHAPAGPWAEACALSLARGREPDLLLIARPYWVFGKEEYKGLGTTHGGPHGYDTHVFMALMGPGIVPGIHEERADPARLAPTVAAWLQIPAPAGSADGALPGVLEER